MNLADALDALEAQYPDAGPISAVDFLARVLDELEGLADHRAHCAGWMGAHRLVTMIAVEHGVIVDPELVEHHAGGEWWTVPR